MAELSLPSAVDFSKKLPHLPENMTSNLATILPNNGTTFRAGGIISWDLPARAGLYLQGNTVFVRYKLRYTSGATATTNYILGTPAVSPFFKLDEYVNSTPVNSVYNYNQVANMYINTHLGLSEKYGVQSSLFSELKAGVNNMDSAGDAVQVTASQASLAGFASLATPLYCSALIEMDKYFPTGLAGTYRIQLTLAQVSDFCLAGITDYQIENVELCINTSDLGAGVDAMVAQMGEQIIIKSTGWANAGVGQVASASTGVVSLLANHRFQSINNLYLLASGADSAKDVNKIFDSRDITSMNGQIQFTIGSQTYPQLPINTAVNKNSVMQYLRECTSSLTDWRYAMSINGQEFSKYLGSANTTAVNGFTPIDVTTVTEPSKFIVGVPVSKVQPMNPYAPSSLLSGVSASSTPIIANINIGTATGQAYNVFVVAEYDVLISVDPMSRSVNVIQ